MAPWGVTESQKLGIYELLRDTCGHELPGWHTYLGPVPLEQRDLVSTTPQHLPALVFYHPAMQEILLQAAEDAGAEVRRGASVRNVKPGELPVVTVEQEGRVEEVQARLVVGVDGRASMVRKWGGFAIHQDPEQLLIAGVLFEEMPSLQEENSYGVVNPSIGQIVLLLPQGQGRVRAYFVCSTNARFRLQGPADIPRFVEESVKTGAPAEFFAGARASGPLATFSGADTWVEHPYKDGVVLVGDAAASSDPTWGQGLSLTVRDVRVLQDQLLSHDDWEVAGHAYAEAHDRHYGVIHTVDNWFTELLMETGPEAREPSCTRSAADRTRWRAQAGSSIQWPRSASRRDSPAAIFRGGVGMEKIAENKKIMLGSFDVIFKGDLETAQDAVAGDAVLWMVDPYQHQALIGERLLSSKTSLGPFFLQRTTLCGPSTSMDRKSEMNS